MDNSKDPRQYLPLQDIPDYWRATGTEPDEGWMRAINARIPEAYHGLFMSSHPDGIAEWRPGYDPDGDEREELLGGYAEGLAFLYKAVRAIDTYSRMGDGGPRMFGGPLVHRRAKEALPGYLDYEEEMERGGLDAAAYREAAARPPRVPAIDDFAGLDLSIPAGPGPAEAQAEAAAERHAARAATYDGGDIPVPRDDGFDPDYETRWPR